MRKKIVAGNWKMNLNKNEANALFLSLNETSFSNDVDVIVCPPAIYLAQFSEQLKGIKLGAQNSSNQDNGAFTGEISAEMLNSLNIGYTLVGHSERREYYNESDSFLSEKVNQLLTQNITPIFCFGEKLQERESENHFSTVKTQIEKGLFHLDQVNFSKIILAYEPVWAIGTGVTASSEQTQEMHAFIRNLVREKYGNETAENIQILYGGSCKPSNAEELFSCPDVDGGLIGGAALKHGDFTKLIEIAASI